MIGEKRMTRRGWAIVTGASGGMGAAFTRSLAKRGYSVLAVARGVEPLARMAEELKKDGAFVETLAVDLASAEGLKAVVDRAHALGDIELLVNNAGLSTSGNFLNQSADELDPDRRPLTFVASVSGATVRSE
jgi:short-subunit dehydrogenase